MTQIDHLSILVFTDHGVHLPYSDPTVRDVDAVCKAFGIDDLALLAAIENSDNDTHAMVVDVEKFISVHPKNHYISGGSDNGQDQRT